MILKYITFQVLCSQSVFIDWLQHHLIPCPFKYLTGIDCPGCGFQRSILALMQGNLHKSFILYPPAIPLLMFFAYGLADKFFKLDTSKNVIKKTFFVFVGTIILVSYCIKIWGFYAHYKASA